MTHQDKINQSIKLIQQLEKPDQKYCVAFSGGKDSIVILDLVKRSGVPFTAQYSNTTIDPPGTLGFIRHNYPEVEILKPAITFYQLIQKKGLPTRKARFCCEFLKERAGIGMRTIDGTRWNESVNRRDYTPEDCDTRKWMGGAIHIRPILQWTNKDVWKYIKENNLPYLKYYDPPYNFNRHGCVGCPYSGVKNQVREFILFPRYAKAIIKALRKYRATKKDTQITDKFMNEYEVFHWWLSDMSIQNFQRMINNTLFPIDSEKVIKETIFKQKPQ